MKRNRTSRIENDSYGSMDISSLVDICFLLLIYFIVTSTVMPAERDLPMGPPGREGEGPKIDIEPLLISIDAVGQVSADQGSQMVPLDSDPTARELPLLEDLLRIYQQGAKASGQDCMVIIDAADGVKHQRVVDVLNALAGQNISKVTFHDRDDGR